MLNDEESLQQIPQLMHHAMSPKVNRTLIFMTGTTPAYQKMASLGSGNVTTLFGEAFPHLHQKSTSNYVIINSNNGTTLPHIGNTLRISNSALQGEHGIHFA
jgi:hypothetical protein